MEARNVVLQYDYVVENALKLGGKGLRLTTPILSDLHHLAIQDIYTCAGKLREGSVRITNTDHTPPPAPNVPGLVCEMCDYINENWSQRSAIHLSAYAMWRHNWIHPFCGGNGRTSRALAYMILCGRLGTILPGSKTIPQQIVDERELYYAALRAADAAWKNGQFDVKAMEQLLSNLLATQLLSVHREALAESPSQTESE